MPVRAPVTEPAAGDLRIARPTAKTLGAKFFLREDHALVRVGSTFGSAPFAFAPLFASDRPAGILLNSLAEAQRRGESCARSPRCGPRAAGITIPTLEPVPARAGAQRLFQALNLCASAPLRASLLRLPSSLPRPVRVERSRETPPPHLDFARCERRWLQGEDGGQSLPPHTPGDSGHRRAMRGAL